MASFVSRCVRRMVARGVKRNDNRSLFELRQSMERMALLIRPPRTVAVERISVDGVPCEWITPKSVQPNSAILYIHGGAFCSGSPATHRHLVGRLSKLTGSAALVPDYRLAPEHVFPAALDDCLSCYLHLLGTGFTPEQIVVAGDSAGGNLALSMLVRLRDGGERLPAAAICLSPVVDLARDNKETKEADARRAPNDPMIRLGFLVPMIDAYVGDRNPADPLLSPLFADLHGLPPTLIQAGGDELLLTDAQALTQRAREAGVETTLQTFDGMWHVWQVLVPYLPEARRAVSAIAGFIKARTAGPLPSNQRTAGR